MRTASWTDLGLITCFVTLLQVIKQLRQVRRDKKLEALVLRIDSPGGDALASDLMWHEIKQVAEKKPVIASMGDVAASGGNAVYALSFTRLACSKAGLFGTDHCLLIWVIVSQMQCTCVDPSEAAKPCY